MAEEQLGTNTDMGSDNQNANYDQSNQLAPEQTNNGESTPSALGGDNQTPSEPTEPTEPTVYDFTSALPDGTELDESVSTDFSKLLNQVGATQEQAVEMAKFGVQYAQNIVSAYQEQQEQAIIERQQADFDTAKKELGGKFDETVALAGKGIEMLSNTVPELRKILQDNHLDNNINMIKLFAAVGEMVQEDPGIGNSTGGTKVLTEQQFAQEFYKDMK